MLNKQKYLKRVIIVSWIALTACFAIKIFGGNFFDIMCHNKKFIAVCEYADNHFWANYAFSCVYCFISLYFYTLAILQRLTFKKWEFFVVIATVFIGTYIKMAMSIFSWLYDIWQGFVMPMVFLNVQIKKYYRILVGAILLIIFQLISMYVKNTSTSELYESTIIGAIYSIDVIIMSILYFAYANLKK